MIAKEDIIANVLAGEQIKLNNWNHLIIYNMIDVFFEPIDIFTITVKLKPRFTNIQIIEKDETVTETTNINDKVPPRLLYRKLNDVNKVVLIIKIKEQWYNQNFARIYKHNDIVDCLDIPYKMDHHASYKQRKDIQSYLKP